MSGPGGLICVVGFHGQSIAELQAAIEARTGISAQSQRLFHGLRELAPSGHVGLAQIDEGSEHVDLLLVRRSPEQLSWLKKIRELPPHLVASWLLECASPAMREDREVILEAVAKNGAALRAASPAFWADPMAVLVAATQRGDALGHAVPELQASLEFVLEVVARNGEALGSVVVDLRANCEVVLAAVAQNGSAFYHAAAELKADREFVLRAVSTDMSGEALLYAAPELRADPEVVAAAMAGNRSAVLYATTELQVEMLLGRSAAARASWRPEQFGCRALASSQILGVVGSGKSILASCFCAPCFSWWQNVPLGSRGILSWHQILRGSEPRR